MFDYKKISLFNAAGEHPHAKLLFVYQITQTVNAARRRCRFVLWLWDKQPIFVWVTAIERTHSGTGCRADRRSKLQVSLFTRNNSFIFSPRYFSCAPTLIVSHINSVYDRPHFQQEWKAMDPALLFGVHWHYKGILLATSRRPLLHCDPKPLLHATVCTNNDLRPFLHLCCSQNVGKTKVARAAKPLEQQSLGARPQRSKHPGNRPG
jgi:hypothetical protein